MDIQQFLNPNILWPAGLVMADLITGSISNAKVKRLSVILKLGIGLLNGISVSLKGISDALQRVQDYGNKKE